MLKAVMERDGCLQATSRRDPSYALQLTRNVSSVAAWRVTSYRDREPIGHREYDVLDGKGPTQNALAEFASDDYELVRRTPPAGRQTQPRCPTP